MDPGRQQGICAGENRVARRNSLQAACTLSANGMQVKEEMRALEATEEGKRELKRPFEQIDIEMKMYHVECTKSNGDSFGIFQARQPTICGVTGLPIVS